MYDLAKRSLAFTVATGGLLLTGTAFSPAMAAAGLGAKEAGGALNAHSVSGSATASDGAATKATRGRAAQPPDVHSHPMSAHGAAGAASSSMLDPGDALTRDVLQVPIDLGLDVCGSTAQVSALRDWLDGRCAQGAATDSLAHSGDLDSTAVQPATAEGSAPTRPGVSAGTGGASATAVSAGEDGTDGTDGTDAADPDTTPIDVPLAACGAEDDAVAMRAVETGARCVAPAAADHATMTGERSGWAPGGGEEDGDLPPHTPVTLCEDDQTGVATVDTDQDDSGCTPCPPPPTCPPTPPPPPPPTCPPSTQPITPFSGPVSTPPSSTTPPATPPTTPGTSPSMSTAPHTPGGPGGLAHTGADVDIALGVAGAALIAGLGLRLAARRREEQ